MAGVKKAGGKVSSEKPEDIPGVGLYANYEDTEGN
jgi:predicted enzyme related to lactoylglutathione lyase